VYIVKVGKIHHDEKEDEIEEGDGKVGEEETPLDLQGLCQ